MAPTLPGIDPGVWPSLQEGLETVHGIDCVMLDEAGGRVWIVGEPGAEEIPLEAAVHQALRSRGIDPMAVRLEFVVRPGRGERRRVRLLAVETGPGPEASVVIRVRLEWRGLEFEGWAAGEPGGPSELRTAAAATLDALRAVVGDDLSMRLVGIKRIRAFDADLMIVSLWNAGPPPRRFVGAVVEGEDMARDAAMAVLHALNRMLGNFLTLSE